ncbi:MAG: hypothetical protein JRH15_16990 [Deltaproteobacteria bacterium]|nr:hypothetical protein [Deltaproteobacteria bacterium]
MLGWANFALMVGATILFMYLYALSVQPFKRQKRIGDAAWQQCTRLRWYALFFEVIQLVCMALWIWIPVPVADQIIPDFKFRIPIIAIISIPFWIILFAGAIHSGKESMFPSSQTELFKGIYRYCRHAQCTGEFPIFLLYAVALNSWVLVAFVIVFAVSFFSIIILYEEKDLVLKYGNQYKAYQKQTGAFFPKLIK